MKIISSYKDFYDGIAAAYYQEGDVTFVRKIQYLEWLDYRKVNKLTEGYQNGITGLFKRGSSISRPSLWNHNSKNPLEPFRECEHGTISFCGKLYPFYVIMHGGKNYYVYGASDYKKFLEEVNAPGREFILKRMELDDQFSPEFRKFRSGVETRITDNNWEKYITGLTPRVELNSYREYKTPIAAYITGAPPPGVPWEYKNCNVIINPNLGEMNFQSVMDPYTAYQELSTYLSNDLVDVSSSTPLPITDKLRAETKGFNDWSFRRHATEDKKYKKKHGE